MPCPHCKITIIKRSNNESAVSAAAYQGGEKLFSEYDQEQKYYPYKNEVTHKEIMLPPHVPPEFADRNTLWNLAEAQEKQWNSQLARRFVLAIPREIPPGQYADLIRDYCREFFVSKGMIADFAIHDKGDGNPHAHILLTMRAMDEKGRDREEELLANCYFNSMNLAMDNGIRSIAFPSISTGVYSFPVELAAKIAVHTVNRFLQDNPDSFDLVEWVLFDTHTESVYEAEVDKLYDK